MWFSVKFKLLSWKSQPINKKIRMEWTKNVQKCEHKFEAKKHTMLRTIVDFLNTKCAVCVLCVRIL